MIWCGESAFSTKFLGDEDDYRQLIFCRLFQEDKALNGESVIDVNSFVLV